MTKPILDNKQVLMLIRQNHPASKKDLNKLKIRYRYLGAGCSRKAYAIGTSLVIKFLLDDDFEHSFKEFEGFLKLSRSRYKKYSPKLFYFNPKTGVTVMRYYKPTNEFDENKKVSNLQKKLNSLFCVEDEHDWSFDNLGWTESGKLKIIDLGIN